VRNKREIVIQLVVALPNGWGATTIRDAATIRDFMVIVKPSNRHTSISDLTPQAHNNVSTLYQR